MNTPRFFSEARGGSGRVSMDPVVVYITILHTHERHISTLQYISYVDNSLFDPLCSTLITVRELLIPVFT